MLTILGALNAWVNDITYAILVTAPLAIFNHMKPGDLIPKLLYPTVHQVVARIVELEAQSWN